MFNSMERFHFFFGNIMAQLNMPLPGSLLLLVAGLFLAAALFVGCGEQAANPDGTPVPPVAGEVALRTPATANGAAELVPAMATSPPPVVRESPTPTPQPDPSALVLVTPMPTNTPAAPELQRTPEPSPTPKPEATPIMSEPTPNVPPEIIPPIAEQRPHSATYHGITIEDPWHWLRDQDYPTVDDEDVLAYLNAENEYFEARMAPYQGLTDAIFEEIKGRQQPDLASVPWKDGDWYYQWKFAEESQYPHLAALAGRRAG